MPITRDAIAKTMEAHDYTLSDDEFVVIWRVKLNEDGARTHDALFTNGRGWKVGDTLAHVNLGGYDTKDDALAGIRYFYNFVNGGFNTDIGMILSADVIRFGDLTDAELAEREVNDAIVAW